MCKLSDFFNGKHGQTFYLPVSQRDKFVHTTMLNKHTHKPRQTALSLTVMQSAVLKSMKVLIQINLVCKVE